MDTGTRRAEMLSPVPYFIERHLCEKLSKRLEKVNLVILRGISASGKSQLAYWYAERFQKTHESSVVYKIKSDTLENLMQSMQDLIAILEMKFEMRETEKEKCLIKMGEMVRDKFCTSSMEQTLHLLVFDDIKSNCYGVIVEFLRSFRKQRNLKIVCTADSSAFFSREDKSKDTFFKVEGVSADEALLFFSSRISKSRNKRKLKKMIVKLANELGNLPFGLVCADAYMSKTGTSVEDYLRRLGNGDFLENVEQCQAQEAYDYNKGLVAALKMSLQDIRERVPSMSVDLMKMIPFLDKNAIPFKLLRMILPDNVSDRKKEDVVDRLIAGFMDHSLCVINEDNGNTSISIHSVTRLVLLSVLSEKEKIACIENLMLFFCKNMNVDARRKSVLMQNMMLLQHGSHLLLEMNKVLKDNEKNIRIRFMECGINAVIGVTFRLYGIEHLLVDEFLKRARRQIFDLAEADHKIFTVESANPKKMMDAPEDTECPPPKRKRMDSWKDVFFLKLINMFFKPDPELKGKSVSSQSSFAQSPTLGKDDKEETLVIGTLFEQLKSAGKRIPGEFLKDIIVKTKRDTLDMEHILSVARSNGIPHSQIRNCPEHHLTQELYGELVKKGIALPVHEIQTIFLVELLIVVLYNNGRNLYLWNTDDDDMIMNCCYDFRLSYLLGQMLKSYIPNFLSVQYLVTKRNGLLYHLMIRSQKSEDAETIRRLHKAVERFESILSDENQYYEFGILKVSKVHNAHNRGMSLQHILSCLSQLYVLYKEEEDKEKVFQQGKKYAKDLCDASEDMSDWISQSGFHVHIGKFFQNPKTTESDEIALEHFEKALELQKENEIFGLSHIYLQAAFGKIRCCRRLAVRLKSHHILMNGKGICEHLVTSLHSSNKQESLKKAKTELEKIQNIQHDLAQ